MRFSNYENRDLIFSEKHHAVDDYYEATDLIPMWVAETDFAIPLQLEKDLIKRIKFGGFGYSFIQDETKKILSNKYNGNNVILDNGVLKSIFEVIRCLTKKNEKIMINSPYYHQFTKTIELANRKVVINELVESKGRYYFDFEKFEEQLKLVKIFIFCNPHNPTGRVWNTKEVAEIIRLCEKNNVLIISDEVHSDLYLGKFNSLYNNESTIVVSAPSKAYNIAGLKVSYISIKNKEIYNKLNEYYSKNRIRSNNVLGLLAMNSVYTKCNDYPKDIKRYVNNNLEFIYSFIKKEQLKIKYHKTEAGFLLWLNFENYFKTDVEIKNFFLEKCKIAPTFGSTCGEKYKTYIRLNVGCSLEKCIKVMELIKKELKEYE